MDRVQHADAVAVALGSHARWLLVVMGLCTAALAVGRPVVARHWSVPDSPASDGSEN